MAITQDTITLATEIMRVCKVCGIEKPIREFGHHRRSCRHCMYTIMTNKNRELYGYATTPAMRRATSACAKERRERTRGQNLELYGYSTSPKEREVVRKSKAKERARNLLMYGTTKTPERLGKERNRKTIIRSKNRELYGTTNTPKERVQALDRYRVRGKNNRELYGTVVPPDQLGAMSRQRTEQRALVLQVYGGKCACCGESRPEVLTIDHIDGKGKTPKNKSGMRLVRAATVAFSELGYPNNKYRLLCWNCNTSIGYYGYCPHNTIPSNILSEKEPLYGKDRRNYQARRNNYLVRQEMIDAYGGQCKLCGETHREFLTLDHIHGNGAQHRRSLGSTGKNTCAFRRRLKRLDWLQNSYRILCANCNSGASRLRNS